MPHLQTKVARMFFEHGLHVAAVVEIISHSGLHIHAHLLDNVQLHASGSTDRQLHTILVYVGGVTLRLHLCRHVEVSLATRINIGFKPTVAPDGVACREWYAYIMKSLLVLRGVA